MRMTKTTKQQLAEMPESARTETEMLRNECLSLKEENQRLRQKSDESDKLIGELRQQLEKLGQQSDAKYELFKSFVEDNQQKILLIDAAYQLRYINRSALKYLKLGSASSVSGRRIFDFFDYKDALRLKEKIDDSFLKGEEEKVKDIRFRNSDEDSVKVRIRISRARYENKPSVKLVLK
jgi:PAS domain-containing protein